MAGSNPIQRRSRKQTARFTTTFSGWIFDLFSSIPLNRIFQKVDEELWQRVRSKAGTKQADHETCKGHKFRAGRDQPSSPGRIRTGCCIAACAHGFVELMVPMSRGETYDLHIVLLQHLILKQERVCGIHRWEIRSNRYFHCRRYHFTLLTLLASSANMKENGTHRISLRSKHRRACWDHFMPRCTLPVARFELDVA